MVFECKYTTRNVSGISTLFLTGGHIFFSSRTQRQKRAHQKKLSEVVLVVVNPHEDKREKTQKLHKPARL